MMRNVTTQQTAPEPSLALYTIYLMRNYNDGSPIPLEHFDWALNRIISFTGGLTRLPPGRGYCRVKANLTGIILRP